MHTGMRSLQMGMSKWALLLVLISLAAVGTATLKLSPHYVDFEVMKGVLDRLPANTHAELSKSDIREHFAKQFRIENFSHKVKDVVKIDRSRSETVVSITYEMREHLFYNVDVVLSFDTGRTFL